MAYLSGPSRAHTTPGILLLLSTFGSMLAAQIPLIDSAPGAGDARTSFFVSGDNLYFSTWGQVYSYDLKDPKAKPVPRFDHSVRLNGEAPLEKGLDGTAAIGNEGNSWVSNPWLGSLSYLAPILLQDLTTTGQGFFWRETDGLWARFAGGDNEFLTPSRFLSRSDHHVLWNVATGDQWQVWLSDGTYPGTYSLGTFDQRVVPVFGTVAQGPTGIHFSALELETGYELWFTDGTQSGTRLIKDTNPGVLSSLPDHFRPANRHLFYMARDPELGWEPHAMFFRDVFSNGFEEGDLIAWN